jgi:hypothetical protein
MNLYESKNICKITNNGKKNSFTATSIYDVSSLDFKVRGKISYAYFGKTSLYSETDCPQFNNMYTEHNS